MPPPPQRGEYTAFRPNEMEILDEMNLLVEDEGVGGRVDNAEDEGRIDQRRVVPFIAGGC